MEIKGPNGKLAGILRTEIVSPELFSPGLVSRDEYTRIADPVTDALGIRMVP